MMLLEPNFSRFHSIHRRVRGAAAALLLIGIVAATFLGAGIYYFLTRGDASSKINPILAEVERGEFVSQVLDQGEVQSSENVEIRCEARARNGALSVIQIVAEGTMVSTGDFLVQLDSTSFDKELQTQKISLTSAETAVIQAEADMNVAIESRREYVDGTFEENKLTIANEIADANSAIKTAEQELAQSKELLEHSLKLSQKGFITKGQLDADGFAVKKAELALLKGRNSLKLAETKKHVLETITFNKEMFQYNSDIEAAKVKLNNQKEALEVERSQLEEIKDMVKKCRIMVPEGVQGQVVYAKESSRGGNDWVLEEGTSVRERQVLIRLPNPDKMEIKALINEQSITLIETGMPTSIRVDALTGLTLKGVVTKVNQYAESSGWMGGSIRKYAVIVKILDPPDALKPGMNASVTIQSLYEKDALTAPIQTIYAVGDQQFCLVKRGESEWETREIVVAANNSSLVMIESGVEPGEQLVMNPGAYKSLMDLPDSKMDERIEVPQAAIDASQKNDGPSAPTSKEGKGNDAKGQREGGKRGGGMGGMNVDMIVDRTMDKYDTNSDGNIDADEQKDFDGRASRLKEADADGDGILSRDEIKKSMEAMMKRFSSGGGMGGGGRRGGGGQ